MARLAHADAITTARLCVRGIDGASLVHVADVRVLPGVVGARMGTPQEPDSTPRLPRLRLRPPRDAGSLPGMRDGDSNEAVECHCEATPLQPRGRAVAAPVRGDGGVVGAELLGRRRRTLRRSRWCLRNDLMHGLDSPILAWEGLPQFWRVLLWARSSRPLGRGGRGNQVFGELLGRSALDDFSPLAVLCNLWFPAVPVRALDAPTTRGFLFHLWLRPARHARALPGMRDGSCQEAVECRRETPPFQVRGHAVAAAVPGDGGAVDH